jgi:Mrp family chromosome partitioning ATPase
VNGTLRSNIAALLLVIGLAAAAGAVVVLVAQATATAFVAGVAWSAASTAGGEDDLRPVLDVEALRAWATARDGLESVVGDVAHVRVRVTPTDDRGGVEVRVEALDRTPRAAAARSAEAAAAVEAWDRATARERSQREIAELDRGAEALAASIRMQQVGDAAAAAATLTVLVVERNGILRRRDALAAVDASESRSGALVRSGATSWTLAPPIARSATVAASLGAALGGAIVVLLSFRTRRSPRERRGPTAPAPSVLTTFSAGAHATSSSREAVDHLRARLIALTPEVDTRVFVVTAPSGIEGKTTVACRLAESLACHGMRTLVVDAVLSAPELSERYLGSADRTDAAAGWSVASTLTWLEDPDGDHRVATVAIGGDVMLDVVPQDRPIWLAPGTAEAFYRGLEDALVRWDGYDAVVIDAPALAPAGDVGWIAPYATGVVLVVGSGRSEERALQEARRLFRASGTPLFGLVVRDDRTRRNEAARALA